MVKTETFIKDSQSTYIYTNMAKLSKTILATNPANLKDGDRSIKFKSYLDSMGINKEEMMAELEAIPEQYAEKVRARMIALQSYKTLTQAVIEFYRANGGREFSFAHELQQLEMDIATHRMKMEDSGEEYTALQDKPLQLAHKRKAELLALMAKEKIDLGKLAVDVKRAGGNEEIDFSSFGDE